MPSHSEAERQVLVDAMLAAGPDAPTLCEGWTVKDLAAHLVARERRPDSGPGVIIPVFARWTEHVRQGLARRPFADLVEDVRTGPPWYSPFAIPGVDSLANLGEHFVHAEDVRRAQQGWAPRELPADLDAELWRTMCSRGGMVFRRCPVGVVLATPDGRRHVVKDGSPAATLTGAPGELVLYAFGRGAHALVELTGEDDAVARVRDLNLGV